MATKAGYNVGLHYHNNNETVAKVHSHILELGQKSILLKTDLSTTKDCSDIF